ncbi:MAG: glycosidase [Chloroflexi bacterium]|nr:glycosidase [Chloroflexota bacterium]
MVRTTTRRPPRAKTSAPRTEPIPAEEAEKRFRQMIEVPLNQAAEIGSADIVVGIPFYNEADTIASVVQTVREGLEEFYPGQKSIIAAVGSPVGSECLEVFRGIPQTEAIRHIAFLLDDERVNGKGWAIRAAMEIARMAGADLAIIEADLTGTERRGEIEGLAPNWLYLLLEPIKRHKMDLVVSHFNRHYLESPISTQLVYPLLTAIYDCPIHDAMGGLWGISHRLLRSYLQEAFAKQSLEIGSYGIDIWLATKAATGDAKICECNLGLKIPGVSGKMELKLRHAVETLFERIVADRAWWTQKETAEVPLRRRLAIFGTMQVQPTKWVDINAGQLLSRYQSGFNRFHGIYSAILPDDIHQRLGMLASSDGDGFSLSDSFWARAIYHFLLAFAFNREFDKGDLINAIVPLFEGRLAGFTLETQSLWEKLTSLRRRQAQDLTALEASRQIEALVDEFILQKQDLVVRWESSEEALKSPVPRVTYREFIPSVHLIVPLEVSSPQGELVSANAIYETIFARYKAEFDNFVYRSLGTPHNAQPPRIVRQIRRFLERVERELDSVLLPGDLSTVEGTSQVVETIIKYFHRDNVLALTPGITYQVLSKNLPSGLLTRLGYNSWPALLREYELNEVLALAQWSEGPEYGEGILETLRRIAKPEHFESTTLQPVVVNQEQLPSLLEVGECGSLCKLAGRVVVSNLRKGTGGDFPKLRYFTTIAKMIIEMETFGKIWRRWAGEKRELGDKVVNSLVGHWGREPLSAHNIFENSHQRVLVKRMKEVAQQISDTAGDNEPRLALRLALAEDLKKVADSYHLAMTLPDGTFIPCSAWSWASYSAKGGVGLPTPLSLHVERDWSSNDFLVEYFKASGGKEEAIDEKIVELMEQGREWEDLAPILLGTAKEADAIMQMEAVPSQQTSPGTLIRYHGNPILKPLKEHDWESRYVLNPGAIRLRGKVYLVYRAMGQDNISRLGLAVSEDGFKFTERLEKPIFEPMSSNEEKGCEDARLTLIGDRIFMLYTAYGSEVAQIGMASIAVNDFLSYKWSAWRRHGMAFPGFVNKDGALFPEQFNRRYAMLHRVDPHIWITFSPRLRCPWPRQEHKILADSTYGMLWDGKKIGGGAPPLKTKYGWLLITHGVDYLRVYRLGVCLLDLIDPAVVIYRSPNAILEPKEKYEEGEPGNDWVPNVVFTCGALPKEDKQDMLDTEDELLVYYGAADSVIGVATARVGDLIPSEYLDDSLQNVGGNRLSF